MRRALILTAAIALLASACSDSNGQEGSPAPAAEGGQSPPEYEQLAADYLAQIETFDLQISQVIEDATEGGASVRQLEVLKQARDEGELSLEMARTAIRATVQCFHDAGLEASYQDVTDAGVVTPMYLVQAQTDGDDAVRDKCDTDESFWVNYLYQSQGAAQAQTVAYIEDHKANLAACIEEAGFDTDGEASGLELAFQALDVIVERGADYNCLSEIGVSGF